MDKAQENQQFDLDVRHFIYACFARTAYPPTSRETADHFCVSLASVEGSFNRLADSHQIALVPGSSSIWMAHPFSRVRTNYNVEIGAKKYWGN